MSVLVAIETATSTGSVAVGRDGRLLGEVVLGAPARHAASVVPALDFLLRHARLERTAITGIVAGAGPGSFTGVRIAAATARGLAAGLNVPLYAWSSLAAVAVAAGRRGLVCALLDARRGEVYAECWEVGAGRVPVRVFGPVAAAVEAVAVALRGRPVHWAGEGALRYADRLGIDAPPPVEPRASTLLRLAADDVAGSSAGLVRSPSGWEPEYLRPPAAERRMDG
jgi:tRNA threonylcarbamoyladenosine biosynthesis protein TsaB